MNKNFLFSIFLFSSLVVCGQNTQDSNCDKLQSKGYTAAFCNFDKNYTFKKIPFESNLAFVSNQCTLKKDPLNALQYFSTDDIVKKHFGVNFDKCIFIFSKNDKLDGIQLILENGSLEQEKIDANIAISEKLIDFQKNVFGVPHDNFMDNKFEWIGENLYLTISQNLYGRKVFIEIFRRNR